MADKNVNMWVDPLLWQEAKIAAIKAGQSLRDYVADAIREKNARGAEEVTSGVTGAAH